jgi:hypothetical protein
VRLYTLEYFEIRSSKTIRKRVWKARKGECKMFRLKNIGGETVGKGNYWNFSTGERVQIEDRGVLPGNPSDSYYRFPPIAVLIAGPILGLTYAVFLPFIGIAMLAGVLAKKLFGGVVRTAWKGAAFGWKPSEAYLSGRKRKAGKTDKKEKDTTNE